MIKNRKRKGVALVTGAAKRIGKVISFKLASMGYAIALHCNKSTTDAQATASMIKKMGGTCDIFPCDLSIASETSKLVKQVVKRFGELHILVNNASVFTPSKLVSSTIEDIDQNFAINFKAPYLLTRDFAIQCKSGNIINIVDTNVSRNTTAHFAYLLSKKSLANFTKMAAIELAPTIRVNAIAPGLILPPEGQDQSFLEKRAKDIPMKKKGQPADIAAAVEFILNSPFLTGQIIPIDGGEGLI